MAQAILNRAEIKGRGKGRAERTGGREH